jgi:hypothetical protein
VDVDAEGSSHDKYQHHNQQIDSAKGGRPWEDKPVYIERLYNNGRWNRSGTETPMRGCGAVASALPRFQII